MDKRKRYQELILKVKTDYDNRDREQSRSNVRLNWFDSCQEINLWTYWQGRGNFDPKIMLVGQDWGSPWDKSANNTIGQILRANNHQPYDYLRNNPSKTDANLIKLFSEIGYDDLLHPQKDLFFTNFVLGYRNQGCSGGYRAEWAKHDEQYFADLVEILEPKIILCLGRATLEAVLNALDSRAAVKIGNYNRFIESYNNPVEISRNSGAKVYIFALAHCGTLGSLNRNRGKEKTQDILEIQRNDWRRIIPYL